MSRFLTFRGFRKVANSVVTSQKHRCPEADKYGTFVRVGLRLPQYRFYRDYTFPARGNTPFSLYSTANIFYRSNYSRSFAVIPARSAVRHHAQLAWKRLSEKFSFNGRGFSGITNIAQAFSLAVTRSNLILPGIFAITSGKLAWAQRSFSETDYHPSPNTLYMRAQDGHAFMTSLVFSVFEGAILVMRALYLGILFSPSIMMAAFADCCGPEFRRLWLHVVHRTLELAGPAFIKWGQWAATRPDLFPRDLCTKLSELHTKAPEHSFAYTKKTIERAFGRKLPEIFDNFEEKPVAPEHSFAWKTIERAFGHKLPESFDNFEEKPVASGSIAQVHGAGQQVKPRVVAVKLRHPGVCESIRRFCYNQSGSKNFKLHSCFKVVEIG